MSHRYNLRSTRPPPPPKPLEGRIQRNRRLIAGRISKKWPITRKNKSSRGLRRNGLNTCYQLSTLQILLHLPKFLNWLDNHNKVVKGQTQWPCRDSSHPDGIHEDLTDPKHKVIPRDAKGCIVCMMKELAKVYWGPVKEDEDDNISPLSSNNPARRPIHLLTMRWFLDPLIAQNLGHQYLMAVRDDQQDANEFLSFVLDHIRESIATTAPGILEQYRALFMTSLPERRTCKCGHIRANYPDNHLGLPNIRLLPKNQDDTVQDAIRRTLAPSELGSLDCQGCGQKAQLHLSTLGIEAGPEYLRVPLSLQSDFLNDAGERPKKFNEVGIENILDLTEYQRGSTTPLRYRLIGVVLHSGETINSGHYIASVTGFNKKRAHIDDDWVILPTDKSSNDALLTLNPLESGGLEFNAYTLWYERVPIGAR